MDSIVNPALVKEAVAIRKKEIMEEFIDNRIKLTENNVKMPDSHNQLS